MIKQQHRSHGVTGGLKTEGEKKCPLQILFKLLPSAKILEKPFSNFKNTQTRLLNTAELWPWKFIYVKQNV